MLYSELRCLVAKHFRIRSSNLLPSALNRVLALRAAIGSLARTSDRVRTEDGSVNEDDSQALMRVRKCMVKRGEALVYFLKRESNRWVSEDHGPPNDERALPYTFGNGPFFGKDRRYFRAIN